MRQRAPATLRTHGGRGAASASLAPSLNERRTGGTAVREHSTVRQRDLLQQRAGLAAAQRRHDDRDLVARLDHVELPADAIEDAGVRAFDGPALDGLVLGVDVLRVELDVDVRVGPLEM